MNGHPTKGNKIPKAPQPKTDADKNLLKPEHMAKIFGTQDNFNMIKSLLHSQQNFNKNGMPDKMQRQTGGF